MKIKRTHIILLAVCLLIAVAIMSEAHYHSSVTKIREGHAHSHLHSHASQNTDPQGQPSVSSTDRGLTMNSQINAGYTAGAATSDKRVTIGDSSVNTQQLPSPANGKCLLRKGWGPAFSAYCKNISSQAACEEGAQKVYCEWGQAPNKPLTPITPVVKQLQQAQPMVYDGACASMNGGPSECGGSDPCCYNHMTTSQQTALRQ